jgi:hypothetical protein
MRFSLTNESIGIIESSRLSKNLCEQNAHVFQIQIDED